MKKLLDRKVLLPLVIVLIALGALAVTTFSGGNSGGHDRSHAEEHGHEH